MLQLFVMTYKISVIHDKLRENFQTVYSIGSLPSAF